MGNCYSLNTHGHSHGAGSSSTGHHHHHHAPDDLTKVDVKKLELETTYQYDGYCSGDTATGEADMSDCDKYKDVHDKHYRTLESFSENDMLPGFEDAFKLIQVVSNQTCLIRVNWVSAKRPENYPSYEHRGTNQRRAGSGCIHINNINLGDATNLYYEKFPPASSDTKKKKVYGPFNVQTAKHVIFDDEEMKHSTLEFFYDSKDKSQVVEAIPIESTGSDDTHDRIDLRCVTFNPDFGRRMKGVERERNELWEKFCSKPKQEENENDFLAVCISHIHASFKHISIGRAKLGEGSLREDGGHTKWRCFTYDTPTCKGSSGAPVWICNQNGSVYAMVPHSYNNKEKRRNHSAVGAVHG